MTIKNIKRLLPVVLLFLAFSATEAFALDLEFSTVEVEADTGTYSIVLSDSSEIGIPKLLAGDTLRLTGVGGLFDGDYYVEETTHSFGGGTFTTRFTVRRAGMGYQSLSLVNYRYLLDSTESGTGTTVASVQLEAVPGPSPVKKVLIGVALFLVGLFALYLLTRYLRGGGRRRCGGSPDEAPSLT